MNLYDRMNEHAFNRALRIVWIYLQWILLIGGILLLIGGALYGLYWLFLMIVGDVAHTIKNA